MIKTSIAEMQSNPVPVRSQGTGTPLAELDFVSSAIFQCVGQGTGLYWQCHPST